MKTLKHALTTCALTVALTATANASTKGDALSDIQLETLKQTITQIEQNQQRADQPIYAKVKDTRLHLYVDNKQTAKGIKSFQVYRIGGLSFDDGIYSGAGVMPHPTLKSRVKALSDAGVKTAKVSTEKGIISIEATDTLPLKWKGSDAAIVKLEDLERVLDLLPVPKSLLVEFSIVSAQQLNVAVAGEAKTTAPATVYVLDFYPED